MDLFEELWGYLQRNLKPGTEIKNWTADKGYLVDTMTIESVTDRAINVGAPNASYVQSVPKEHFEIVFKVWEGYKAKVVKRHHIRDMTRFSKYIISIMKWREDKGSAKKL